MIFFPFAGARRRNLEVIYCRNMRRFFLPAQVGEERESGRGSVRGTPPTGPRFIRSFQALCQIAGEERTCRQRRMA
jgi:hypothetical protein